MCGVHIIHNLAPPNYREQRGRRSRRKRCQDSFLLESRRTADGLPMAMADLHDFNLTVAALNLGGNLAAPSARCHLTRLAFLGNL